MAVKIQAQRMAFFTILVTMGLNLKSPALAAINANEFNCSDLRKASLKLPVYATNIANLKSTRTTEGGPFRRIELKCKELYCETNPKDDFRLVYEPNHPDASQSGFVKYPRIDLATEYASLSNAANEVKLLATREVCGAKAITSMNSSIIKYEAGASIQTDVFHFDLEGKLQSWTRTLRDGTTQTYAFRSDGTLSRN